MYLVGTAWGGGQDEAADGERADRVGEAARAARERVDQDRGHEGARAADLVGDQSEQPAADRARDERQRLQRAGAPSSSTPSACATDQRVVRWGTRPVWIQRSTVLVSTIDFTFNSGTDLLENIRHSN